jgi:uncharacterized protein YciI
MQFVIIGLGGTDKDAPARRQAVRQAHIAMGERLLAAHNLWYGAVLLNDDRSMKGSLYVVSFTSEKALHEWLYNEPYVIGGIWRDITIHKSNTRAPWQYSHHKEWFQEI